MNSLNDDYFMQCHNVKELCFPLQILLHIMHKYHVEVVIVPYDEARCEKLSFPMYETTFIAVSAYQNADLIKLKIENNKEFLEQSGDLMELER